MNSTCTDFENYLKKYATKHNEGNSISLEEALTHQIVKDVEEYYNKGEHEHERNH